MTHKEFSSRGGKAGTGEAKRRPPEHYRRLARLGVSARLASGLNRADAAAWRETHCAKNKSKQPQAVVACFVKLAGVCCAPMTPTTEQLSQVVRVLADHVLLMDKYVLALAEARESQNQFIATRMPGLTTRPERWHAACFPNEIDLHVRIANRLRLSKLPATGVGESPWGWAVWKFRPINQ